MGHEDAGSPESVYLQLAQMRRERDEARAQLRDAVETWTRVSDKLTTERDTLRALLREVEWANAGRCLFCRRLGTVNNEQEPYGHTPDCRLKAALEGRDG